MQFWGLAVLFIGIWAGVGAVVPAGLSRKLLARDGAAKQAESLDGI